MLPLGNCGRPRIRIKAGVPQAAWRGTEERFQGLSKGCFAGKDKIKMGDTRKKELAELVDSPGRGPLSGNMTWELRVGGV